MQYKMAFEITIEPTNKDLPKSKGGDNDMCALSDTVQFDVESKKPVVSVGSNTEQEYCSNTQFYTDKLTIHTSMKFNQHINHDIESASLKMDADFESHTILNKIWNKSIIDSKSYINGLLEEKNGEIKDLMVAITTCRKIKSKLCSNKLML